MKGVVFQKPLEYNLEVSGETWTQGSEVSGQLVVKNHGDSPVQLDDNFVKLAFGTSKLVKTKSDDAFKEESSFSLDGGKTLAAGEQMEFPWSFRLSKSCPISDKSGSYYLLYGNSETIWNGGQLQLPIEPQKIFLQFVELFENFHRFKLKGKKSNKKGFVEFKLDSPKTGQLKTVENLALQLKLEEDELDIHYKFKVSNIDYGSAGVNLKKGHAEFDQKLTKKQFLSFGDAINQDGINQAISEILDKVKLGQLFEKD